MRHEPAALHYDAPLYRPPSEADSLILQATLGCSFNRCSFCSMYKSKSYVARQLAAVYADIAAAAQAWPETRRVFLADGDALVLPMDSLRLLLDRLAAAFPSLTRVSAYATPKAALEKGGAALQELKQRRLGLLYLGVESGSTAVLKRVHKGAAHKTIVNALKCAAAAGVKVSATMILGLSDQDDWEEHIAQSAALINRAPPTYLSTLQLTLHDDAARAEFLSGQEAMFRFQDDAGMTMPGFWRSSSDCCSCWNRRDR